MIPAKKITRKKYYTTAKITPLSSRTTNQPTGVEPVWCSCYNNNDSKESKHCFKQGHSSTLQLGYNSMHITQKKEIHLSLKKLRKNFLITGKEPYKVIYKALYSTNNYQNLSLRLMLLPVYSSSVH